MKETNSKRLFEESSKYIPGGVNSPVRAYTNVDRVPRFIDRAYEDKIVDVDGNTYIDYVCSWGPCILGHSHERVIEKVKEGLFLKYQE